MKNSDLQLWYEAPRELANDEQTWIEKMLDIDLPNKDILIEQLKHSKVIGQCMCGCKTINIQVDHRIEKYPYGERIPVEVMSYESGQAPIMFLLHVVDGYINELEVLRADSTPITGEIHLLNVEVTNNLR